jgi:hypothetical protein
VIDELEDMPRIEGGGGNRECTDRALLGRRWPGVGITAPSRRFRRPGAPYSGPVSTHASDESQTGDLELPVEELLRRARPLPTHDEMVIEDLTEDEGVAFLEAIKS